MSRHARIRDGVFNFNGVWTNLRLIRLVELVPCFLFVGEGYGRWPLDIRRWWAVFLLLISATCILRSGVIFCALYSAVTHSNHVIVRYVVETLCIVHYCCGGGVRRYRIGIKLT